MTPDRSESPEERADRRSRRRQRLRDLGIEEVTRPKPAPGEERTQLTVFFGRPRPSDNEEAT